MQSIILVQCHVATYDINWHIRLSLNIYIIMYNFVLWMRSIKIKGTACGIYNVAPLSDLSLHNLQALVGELYHTQAVIYHSTVYHSTSHWPGVVIRIALSRLAVKPILDQAIVQRRLVTIFAECTFNYRASYAMYCFC